MSSQNYVKIFDTTLRDGEQSPGCSMNLAEKLRVAEQLEALGVDIIEAGFAIASEGDFEAVQAVARQAKKATVASLARAAAGDIDRAWAALKDAKNPRIHTFIATSPLHMRVKLEMEPEAVLEKIRASVSHARNLCPDVEWSAEDATRSDLDFLCRASESAVRQRVRETLDICMPGGGYCLGTGNSVANYIPLNNYLAMVDEGRKYRVTGG